MRIAKVQFSVGFTVNLGNYESARFDTTIQADVEEGEDVFEVLTEIEGMAKSQLICSMTDTIETLPGKMLAHYEKRLGFTPRTDEEGE